MTTLAATAKTTEDEFQTKMKERLRASIGDLLPDAMLKDIVVKGIQEAFFTKQKRGSGYYTEEYPSWLVEYIQKECRSQVENAVQSWIANNPEVFRETTKTVLAEGVLGTVYAALRQVLLPGFDSLTSHIESTVQRLLARTGQ